MEKGKGEEDDVSKGWSDEVEDLVDKGDVEGAISLLESVVSSLQTLDSSSGDDLRLASAISDLADLHSSRAFSLKADELRSRALLLRACALDPHASRSRVSKSLEMKEKVRGEDEVARASEPVNDRQQDDDDWEAVADHVVSGKLLLSSQQEAEASIPSKADPSPKGAPKRRGRGSFLYRKNCLYSDQPDVGTTCDNKSVTEDEVQARDRLLEDEDSQLGNLGYGTGHVLVLYDFSPTTRTRDLEKLFDNFQSCGFAIRWVNDTTALAVFRTPSIAHEAQNSIRCPFKVRQLDDDDDILAQISRRDLEPPIPRPKTSARTAQRLIAQELGIKFPNNFGAGELRKQESARKSRIIARQTMKDDAWGSD